MKLAALSKAEQNTSMPAKFQNLYTADRSVIDAFYPVLYIPICSKP